MVLGLEFIKYRKTNLQNVILGVAQDLVVFVKLFDGYRLHVCCGVRSERGVLVLYFSTIRGFVCGKDERGLE